MAEAVLHQQGVAARRPAPKAGLSENAVGPRLARTAALAPYANDEGRVTAAGVERARYDAETGAPPPAASPPPPPRCASSRVDPAAPPKGS